MSIAEQKAKINSEIQALRKKIQLSDRDQYLRGHELPLVRGSVTPGPMKLIFPAESRMVIDQTAPGLRSLEGESKAFYEESEGEKQANKATITTLRGEIKHLHVKIEEAKQGSERSVERVLQQRRRAISAPIKVKKAEGAIKASEYKLHDLVKRLNFLQHSRKQVGSSNRKQGSSSSSKQVNSCYRKRAATEINGYAGGRGAVPPIQQARQAVGPIGRANVGAQDGSGSYERLPLPSKELERLGAEVTPVNERIMAMRLKHAFGFMSLIAMYAHTNVCKLDVKEVFYAKLTSAESIGIHPRARQNSISLETLEVTEACHMAQLNGNQELHHSLMTAVRSVNGQIISDHVERENRLSSLKQQLGESSSDRVQEEHRTIQQLQQDLIALENEQERVGVSVTEAESVKRRYGAMVTALKGEAAAYRTTLDTLHARLAEEKDSLKNLRDSRKKAEKTRDCLRTRLHEEEESAYETKREREKRLFEFRKKAEERRQQDLGAAVDRRLSIMRTPTRRDSPTAALTQDTQEQIEAELEKYQQLFSRLKEVLGVTSVEEVLDRLTSQAGTREHLRQLRSVTLEEVTRLKQEKEQLHEELHRVKYASTEDAAKMVGMIEDLKKKVEEKETMKEDLSGRLDGTLKILAGVRAGQEHIAEKLEVTAENERPPKAESPLQYLVVLMAFCMDRARELMEEVRDAQIDQKLAEMVEEEKDSGGMMTSPENIRVAFPAAGATAKAAQQQVHVEEGGDSGEEEETLTRKFIKRQAQMIVEAKARKRNRPVTSFKS
ncbi:outer dynein arm-docking complex subunit 3-like [Penaeus indicus]|uniref:outer dynein arm-docking complex subunit 3-like n=1 Tax=Penaeus indicus TaxID=29960 RepID=UPI00300CD5B9